MSQSVNNAGDVMGLFDDAVQGEEISQQTADILVEGLNDTDVVGCTGEDVDELSSDDVTLASFVIDDSYSMIKNVDAVRESYDQMIKAYCDSKQADSMLVSTRIFSEKGAEKVLHGFKKVEDIEPIGANYQAQGNGTALYDSVKNALRGIMAYSKQLSDSGIRVKCCVIVFSDGGDNDSSTSAQEVKTISEDCLNQEMYYLVYVGYGSNLDSIAGKIGFPNKLTTTNDPSQIRKTVGLVSKSVIRASQTQIGNANSFFS